MTSQLQKLQELDRQIFNIVKQREMIIGKRRKLAQKLSGDAEFEAYQAELMDFLTSGEEPS